MRRILLLPALTFCLVASCVLTACSKTMTASTMTSLAFVAAARAEIAPSGKLRAAINLGNPILANSDAGGDPRGVSVDLARELAKRLDVPLEFVVYHAAGKVVEIKKGEWDIAYFAIDPVRAQDVDFTAPYVIIEGAYLVTKDSPITRNDEVDRPGIRVVAGRGSAYDLYLTRELKHATLTHAPTSQAVTDTMLKENFEVAAGVKQQLQADAQRLPNVRLLEGRFMVINQAMTLPKGKPAGAKYLVDFVEEMKASGFVAASLSRHQIEGAVVAPAGR